MSAPVCVWLTRHSPTPQQRFALHGYSLVQPTLSRFDSPRHAWWAATLTGTPDVVVFVLPQGWVNEFVRLATTAAPGCALVRAVMMHRIWCGRWERLVWERGAVVAREWMPMGERVG